jgi:hypothetical protein
MHGGLPLIGVSVLVYGVVGAVATARDALRRFGQARPGSGATQTVAGAGTGAGTKAERGMRAWPAASQ